MLKDSNTGYGLITIIFHWLSALLIVFLFGLGVYMRGLDYYSPWYHRGPEIHIAIGLFVFLLMSIRLFWRTSNLTPDAIPTISKLQLLAAKLIKIALYVGVFVICITGYFITTAEGKGANFFDLFAVPATIKLGAEAVDFVGFIHKYLSWAVIAMALLHALAALVHHFVKRDKTLVRMLKPASKAN